MQTFSKKKKHCWKSISSKFLFFLERFTKWIFVAQNSTNFGKFNQESVFLLWYCAWKWHNNPLYITFLQSWWHERVYRGAGSSWISRWQAPTRRPLGILCVPRLHQDLDRRRGRPRPRWDGGKAVRPMERLRPRRPRDRSLGNRTYKGHGRVMRWRHWMPFWHLYKYRNWRRHQRYGFSEQLESSHATFGTYYLRMEFAS